MPVILTGTAGFFLCMLSMFVIILVMLEPGHIAQHIQETHTVGTDVNEGVFV